MVEGVVLPNPWKLMTMKARKTKKKHVESMCFHCIVFWLLDPSAMLSVGGDAATYRGLGAAGGGGAGNKTLGDLFVELTVTVLFLHHHHHHRHHRHHRHP